VKTKQFAAENIVFNKPATPITGPFRLEQYRFLEEPMDAADDIYVKCLVILKASSSMGSVLGEIINTKRIACDVGDQIMVCQTEEKAENWSKTRGKDWLKVIPNIARLISTEKYAVTNRLWQFRHKDLFVFGPGINNAQSDQVRYLQTDEGHLNAYLPGALTEWTKRLGGKWHSQATHISTAGDVGKEITTLYLEGDQSEWHLRCVKCSQLIDPIWSDDAALDAKYNGERIFRFNDDDTSPILVCPHCQHVHRDTSRERFALNSDGGYVAANPSAERRSRSFRWPVFAMHAIAWSGLLSEYRASIEAAKLGDLKPHEDWIKKRECRPYVAEIPDFGLTKKSEYASDEVWNVEGDKLRVCTFDFQEGHGAEGVHWWGQVDEWRKNGESRRIAFKRLESWADCRAFQLRHGVLDANTYCDAGHRDKEVFARCSEWRWFALIASDSTEFQHHVTVEGRKLLVPNPYFTQAQPQDSMSGQAATVARKRGIHVPKGRSLPKGWCLSRTWSKPNVGFLLMRLKDAKLQEYGIPRDIDDNFLHQLNSYVETVEKSKKTGTYQRILKQVKEADHSFATSSMSLLGAIIRGFFPLSGIPDDDKSGHVSDDLPLAATSPEREVNDVP